MCSSGLNASLKIEQSSSTLSIPIQSPIWQSSSGASRCAISSPFGHPFCILMKSTAPRPLSFSYARGSTFCSTEYGITARFESRSFSLRIGVYATYHWWWSPRRKYE